MLPKMTMMADCKAGMSIRVCSTCHPMQTYNRKRDSVSPRARYEMGCKSADLIESSIHIESSIFSAQRRVLKNIPRYQYSKKRYRSIAELHSKS
jgi:hypothetical protein